jgi:hypothetical protein
MGLWSLLIALGLLVAFLGLFTHWTIIALGAALPVLPVVLELVRRRRRPPD